MPGALTDDVEDVVELEDKRRVAKKAGSLLLPRVAEELKELKAKLMQAQKQQDLALKDMELWSRREKETTEYNDFLATEEVPSPHNK